ncbi:BRO-N domain-containing protein [Bacillus thuringiensis]
MAEWIDRSNPTMMLKSVDEDEKRLNFVYTSTGNKDAWFLTEDGIYELLMQSRKPIAKQWKKEVKKILKNIRLNGGHVQIDREEDEKLGGKIVPVWWQDCLPQVKMEMIASIDEVELPEEGSSFVRSLQVYLVSYFET